MGNSHLSGPLTVAGGFVGDLTGNVTGLALQGATTNAATSGAVVVPLTELFSGYTTNATAAIAATLADGVAGQMKIIKLIAKDTNNMVVTYNGSSTLTFDATGEIAVLVFSGTDWVIVYNTSTAA